MAQSGPDTADFVGGDAHPQARGANQNGAIRHLVRHRLGGHIGQIRVVDRSGVVGSDIDALMPHLADDGLDQLLGVITPVVASYCYSHIASSLILALTAASM